MALCTKVVSYSITIRMTLVYDTFHYDQPHMHAFEVADMTTLKDTVMKSEAKCKYVDRQEGRSSQWEKKRFE